MGRKASGGDLCHTGKGIKEKGILHWQTLTLGSEQVKPVLGSYTYESSSLECSENHWTDRKAGET